MRSLICLQLQCRFPNKIWLVNPSRRAPNLLSLGKFFVQYSVFIQFGVVPMLLLLLLYVVLCCAVLGCAVLCRRRCYQKAKGRDVYPRVQVNGLGCVCCVRAVRKCVVA